MSREALRPVSVPPEKRIRRPRLPGRHPAIDAGTYHCGRCRSCVMVAKLIRSRHPQRTWPIALAAAEVFDALRPLISGEFAIDLECSGCSSPMRFIVHDDPAAIEAGTPDIIEILEIDPTQILFAEELSLDEVGTDEEVAEFARESKADAYDYGPDEEDDDIPEYGSVLPVHDDDRDAREQWLRERPRLPWPPRMREQTLAVRAEVRASPYPLSAGDLAELFVGVPSDHIDELLDMLSVLGAIRRVNEDRYAAQQ
jgi:hypothetical protein